MIKLAGIWNVNSVYDMNSKQISAKLSFEIGEKFSARVLNLNKYTGEILLKLLDGWKFSAQIDNPKDIVENKLIRLQVEGFENDKLKLKIVTAEEKGQSQSKDSIKLFIKENSTDLSSEDYGIIEKMVKGGIPLTKDNISNVKTTIDFMNKIKENLAEGDIFIKNYLISKNVEPNSEKGNFIKDTLKNFFSELKNVSKEDLFILLENNIELNEDNIKSFNRVFKQEGTIYNELKGLNNILKQSGFIYNNTENLSQNLYKEQNNILQNDKISTLNEYTKVNATIQNINKLDELLNKIKIADNNKNFNIESDQDLGISENINHKDIDKSSIKEKIYNIFDLFDNKKEVPFNRENISSLKRVSDFIDKTSNSFTEKNMFIKSYLFSRNIDPDSQKGTFIKEYFKSFFSELRNVNKEDLLNLLGSNIELSEDNTKKFNQVYSQVYDLDKKEVNNKKQYEGITNNNLNIDEKVSYANGERSNAKLAATMESIDMDRLNEFSDKIKNMNGEDKLQTKNPQSLNIGENITAKNVKEEGLKGKLDNVLNFFEKEKVIGAQTSKDSNLASGNVDGMADNVKRQISIKTDEMKDIIRTFLEQNNDSENKASKNIISQLNSSVNDFKLFNTISNSYYYMDLPVNLNDIDYQCKLMIKDDRKKGKKIDATNVKIITSISTENMGIVDAYLTVNNINMNVDIKCSKEWIGLMKQGYETILESLSNIGYNINIEFHEKKEKMNISTCREFFDDNDIGMLNTRA